MLKESIFYFLETKILHLLIREIEKKFTDFKEVKKNYLNVLKKLRTAGYDADGLNAALEQRQAADLLFAGRLGFQANLNHFRSPEIYDFLSSPPDCYLREVTMLHMPMHIKAEKDFDAIMRIIPEDESFVISDYASYLYTTVPRLAHYYGYLLGNRLLYFCEPGYTANSIYTLRYQKELEHYWQIQL